MSAGETLRAIARGERAEGLLHNCRLLTDKGEAYGVEGVTAHFRSAPLALAEVCGDGSSLAGVAGDSALFADAYGPNIARLWRVGSDGPVLREPRVDVAFDPDMHLARGDVMLSASDFPHVDAEHLDRIAAAARAAVASDTLGAPTTRSRLFLLRVATGGDRIAALFAHHRLALKGRTDAGFRHVALLLDGEGARWVFGREDAEREWTPRA